MSEVDKEVFMTQLRGLLVGQGQPMAVEVSSDLLTDDVRFWSDEIVLISTDMGQVALSVDDQGRFVSLLSGSEEFLLHAL